MGKYEPLSEFLKEFRGDSWETSFAEIERILGFPLPRSAHEHRAWWANQFKGHHSQAKGWIDAGWVTSKVDQKQRRIKFERAKSKERDRAKADGELWAQAERVTGIRVRAQLERAAVNALIQREAGRTLATMAGSMPHLAVPERERPPK